MHIGIKIALGTVLLISCGACQGQNQTRQPPQGNIRQPQGNVRQLQHQQQQCILQKEQRIAQAASKQAGAKLQGNYCSTDACQDYWRIKEAEANEEYNRAIQAANSLDCFVQ